MIGESISHFEVIEQLGAGSQGIIYKARDVKLKRTVVLKVVPLDFVSDEEDKNRLFREAQATAALNHPNICVIYEVNETSDYVFIAMAHVDGQNLKEIIGLAPLTFNEILAIAIQIARGLQAAHEHDIVHRDIKSANIMVTPDGAVKILDFGLAKLHGSARLTKLGSITGSLGYMSPEQARGDTVDFRTDLYSFGVVLYEMVTCRLPFPSVFEHPLSDITLMRNPIPLSTCRLDLPASFESLVNRCLAHDPRKRYQSAAEIVEALEDLISNSIQVQKPGMTRVPEKAHARFGLKAAQTFLSRFRKKHHPVDHVSQTFITLDAGQIISHYRIAGKLGVGGMGVVYKAEDVHLQRPVALKFLPNAFANDPEARQRILVEAQAASMLDHPHIGTIYEVSEADGQIFIAMAYYEGPTLKQRINEGPIPLNETIEIIHQVAQGLAKAHDNHVIHRDIKPSNIIITLDGLAKILDFGLAVRPNQQIDETERFWGTVAYMSPEQACGKTVDPRTDIWSLGVVFYEVLAGQRPFQGELDQAVLYSVIQGMPESLSKIRPDLPVEIIRVVEKMLEKDPDGRYKDTEALGAELVMLKNSLSSTQSMTVSHRMEQDHSVLKAQGPSIAVLPFSDLSKDKDQEFFCDGIAEELINAFTRLEGLHVVSRTSSSQFKERTCDIREVGNRLNVTSILEGSVRKAGDRLRITAQLIDVSDGYHLWSEKYDRDFDDIFAIQDEISLAIVERLKVKLIGDEKVALTKRYTDNTEAYTLYLKGRFHWNKQRKTGLDRAIDYFQQAIELDTSYALAYAGLADSHSLYGYFNIDAPKNTYPKARKAAELAVAIDSTLAEAYTSLAFCEMFYDWKWQDAKLHLGLALQYNPRYETAHHWQALYHQVMGYFDDALAEINAALRLDPLSMTINTTLGNTYYLKRQYDRAENQLKKTLEIDPDFIPAQLYLGLVYIQKAQYSEAITSFQKACTLSNEAPITHGFLGYAFACAGAQEESYGLIEKLHLDDRYKYVSPFFIAIIYIGLGEFNKAFDWIQKAHNERDAWIPYLNVLPFFDSLRNNSRFIQLVQKSGLD